MGGDSHCTALHYVLRESKLKPFATLASEGPRRRYGLHRFRDGDNHFLGVSARAGHSPRFYKKTKARITMQEPRHVYEVRTGEYLGETQEFDAVFNGERFVNIYSCLPYQVLAITSADQKQARRGERVDLPVTFKTSKGLPGRHVVRVTVHRPDGTEEKILGYNLTTKEGTGTAQIPLAYNAQPGAWKVKLRDVATGVAGEASLEVTQ